MTREVAFKAIDTILDQDKMGGYLDPEETPGVILDFIGGEPLLEIELIEDIVDYFRWKAFELNHPWLDCYMFSFSSNGLLYFDKNVQRFLDKNDGRVSLAITIDGDKTLHDACRVDVAGQGTYDRVSEAIKDLVEKVGKKNGLVIATCNLLDMDIPIENAITMHFAVDKYSARYL